MAPRDHDRQRERSETGDGVPPYGTRMHSPGFL
jgi:hypothetical protein